MILHSYWDLTPEHWTHPQDSEVLGSRPCGDVQACAGSHVVGGPWDFSVSPRPFGLDFGTLDFGTSDLGLTI